MHAPVLSQARLLSLALLAAITLAAACSPSAPVTPPDATPAPNTPPPTGAPAAVLDLSAPPPVTDADRPLAGAFAPLDGVWKGTFRIYTDTRGQRDAPNPERLDPAGFAKPPYALQSQISVTQRYTSESPYFQRVVIEDTYTDGSGQMRVVRSQGVNKVQDGKLWCVVVKPDDTVVHIGEHPDAKTLIWSRDVRDPLRVERFDEVVEANTYTIVGWGKYAGDDPAKSPRMFFHGVYTRQE